MIHHGSLRLSSKWTTRRELVLGAHLVGPHADEVINLFAPHC